MSDTRETVYATLRRVAEDENIPLQELSDESCLVDDLGFRSLHIARILAILDTELFSDPFGSGELPLTGIRTVGDLRAAYEGVDVARA